MLRDKSAKRQVLSACAFVCVCAYLLKLTSGRGSDQEAQDWKAGRRGQDDLGYDSDGIDTILPPQAQVGWSW